MEKIKAQIYRLYRMTAKLNIYTQQCDADDERISNELSQIRKLADEIITTINQ
jgi:hypothetical protein